MSAGNALPCAEAEAAAEEAALAEESAGSMDLNASTMADCMSQHAACCEASPSAFGPASHDIE